MTYSLEFHEQAFREWKRLNKPIQQQFKKKLAQRLEAPHVPASRLRGPRQRYKIKLRTSGFRLVYEVRDADLVVFVVVIGKRDKSGAYKLADMR